MKFNIECFNLRHGIWFIVVFTTCVHNFNLFCSGISLHNHTYTGCTVYLYPRFVVVSPSMLWLLITWELECLKIKISMGYTTIGVVYRHGQSHICGGSRWSDHCACLTGSYVTFPLLFSRTFSRTFSNYFIFIFPYFFFFSRTVFPILFFIFFPYFFLSSSTKCWLGCSLRRPRPITFYELTL